MMTSKTEEERYEELHEKLSNYSDRQIVVGVLDLIDEEMFNKLMASLEECWG